MIVRTEPECIHRIGEVHTVVEGERPLRSTNLWRVPLGTMGHRLSGKATMFPGAVLWYPTTHLEPYRDDGSERGEWTAELKRLCRVKENA